MSKFTWITIKMSNSNPHSIRKQKLHNIKRNLLVSYHKKFAKLFCHFIKLNVTCPYQSYWKGNGFISFVIRNTDKHVTLSLCDLLQMKANRQISDLPIEVGTKRRLYSYGNAAAKMIEGRDNEFKLSQYTCNLATFLMYDSCRFR